MHPLRHLTSIAPLFAVTLLTACGEPDPIIPDPVPTTIVIVAGDGQRAVQGLQLEDSVIVRVLDQNGRTLQGAEIAFTPGAGHGQVDSASAATDAGGEATAFWTLGSDPGDQTLNVAAGEATASVGAVALDLEAELDALFVPATGAEIDAISVDWAGRDYSVAGVQVEFAEEILLAGTPANLRIVSHLVSGHRHYGAIVVPQGADSASLHLATYLHGGDGGVSTADLQFVALPLGGLRNRFAYVLPSFRSEPLRHDSLTWVSEGTSSHWDYDVDDAMALVSLAFELTPEAKPGVYSIIGGSRGAGVALLAGARDERIERLVAFFGPTDFFDEWVREIVWEAAMRMPRRLTGVAHLDSTIVQPFIRGEMTRPEARLELVRRSSVLYAEKLPPVQLHHGTIDQTVSVSQAESMIAAMEALGRGPPDFEAYIYEDGGHDFLSLREAIQRAVEFISRSLGG